MDDVGPDQRMKYVFPLLLTLCFLALGPYMIYIGLTPFLEDNDKGDWASTQGSIVDSGIQSVSYQTRGGKQWHYYPAFQYSYEVEGMVYVEISRAPVGHFSSETEAQGYLDEHPIGSAVEVYYDPLDPSSSVLDRTTFDVVEQSAFFAAGITMIVLGSIVPILLLKKMRK